MDIEFEDEEAAHNFVETYAVLDPTVEYAPISFADFAELSVALRGLLNEQGFESEAYEVVMSSRDIVAGVLMVNVPDFIDIHELEEYAYVVEERLLNMAPPR